MPPSRSGARGGGEGVERSQGGAALAVSSSTCGSSTFFLSTLRGRDALGDVYGRQRISRLAAVVRRADGDGCLHTPNGLGILEKYSGRRCFVQALAESNRAYLLQRGNGSGTDSALLVSRIMSCGYNSLDAHPTIEGNVAP